MSNNYFTKNLKFLPHRLMSEEKAKNFFSKKSGETNEICNYTSDLSAYKSILIFVPEHAEVFYTYLPFILHLKKSRSSKGIRLFSPLSQRKLITTLELANSTIFYKDDTFMYGEEDFKALENKLSSEKFDLALMLDSKPSLLTLYLCKKSGAPVRLGVNTENSYPFINLSLKPRIQKNSYYNYRHSLLNHFGLDETKIISEASFYSRNSIKEGSNSATLSTKQVILLNMEEDLEGKAWTSNQIKNLISISKKNNFRLLALYPTANDQPRLRALTDQFDLKKAPIPPSSSALLDMLKQYRALITRNSAHWHLCFNLGHVPTLLITDQNENSFLPEQIPKTLLISSDTTDFKPKEIEELLNISIK